MKTKQSKNKEKLIVGGIIALILVAGLLTFIMPPVQTVSIYMKGNRPLPNMEEYKTTLGSDHVLSIDPVVGYVPGSLVTKTLTVTPELTTLSVVADDSIIDNDYTDGSVTYVYVRAITFFNGNDIISEDWIKLTREEYSKTFTNTWDNSGKYAYVLFMVSAESNFNYDTQVWSDYVVTPLDKEKYLFNIFPISPPNPLQWLSDFFTNIIAWIGDFF